MGTPLPGQRAAQRPMRAAMAAQRALGRSAGSSGTVTDLLIANIGGRFMQSVSHPDGSQTWEPYDINDSKE